MKAARNDYLMDARNGIRVATGIIEAPRTSTGIRVTLGRANPPDGPPSLRRYTRRLPSPLAQGNAAEVLPLASRLAQRNGAEVSPIRTPRRDDESVPLVPPVPAGGADAEVLLEAARAEGVSLVGGKAGKDWEGEVGKGRSAAGAGGMRRGGWRGGATRAFSFPYLLERHLRVHNPDALQVRQLQVSSLRLLCPPSPLSPNPRSPSPLFFPSPLPAIRLPSLSSPPSTLLFPILPSSLPPPLFSFLLFLSPHSLHVFPSFPRSVLFVFQSPIPILPSSSVVPHPPLSYMSHSFTGL
ncbi:unnamed protein product [Closterium sp. Naga37s-1]|nr:unnamed protein product [Closterium sp. Naga37s-1]